MGDPRGFMKYDRANMPKRPVEERVKDWKEFEHPVDDEKMADQGARCMDCGIPFCHSGCPLGNLIPEWNDLVYQGRYEEAVDRLHLTNNFPEVTGRVCPAPCEASCVLGINEPPVSIKQVEFFISEKAREMGMIVPMPPTFRTGHRVAVVGSGPAGLAAAQQLNRAGHTVTVYERADRIGGLLRYGIPDFKMEKTLVDERVAQMSAEGVEFITSANVGLNVDVADLKDQYNAILLAGGSTKSRDLPIPGRDLDGVHFAMEFLPQQNKRVAGDTIEGEIELHAGGKKVIVIGGGDTGSDCVGTSIRQGCESVTQIELLAKPPAERPEENPWPEWPMVLRTSSSHEEGAVRDWAVNTKAFEGEDGRVKRMRCVRLDWKKVDGRWKHVEIPDSEFTLEADLVLLAMGFTGPETTMVEQFGVTLDARGNVATDANYATNVPGIFTAGDMRRGQSLVVWAITEGRKAATAIDGFLALSREL